MPTLSSGSSARLFFFNDTATTEIYTLSLHDALPILLANHFLNYYWQEHRDHKSAVPKLGEGAFGNRSEEHTSELQSQSNLVCRLLLEKKKTRPQRTSSSRSAVKYANNVSGMIYVYMN